MRPSAAGLGIVVALVGASCDTKGGGAVYQDAAVLESPLEWPLPPLFRERWPQDGPPHTFIMAPNLDLSPEEFVRLYAAKLYGLTPVDELVLQEKAPSVNGISTWRYQQLHGGHPVIDAGFVLDVLNGHVTAGGGTLAGGVALDLTVRISEPEARQRIVDELGASTRKGRRETPGELVIADRRLVWQFHIPTHEGEQEEAVEVDPRTGAIVRHWDVVCHQR